MLDYNVKVNIVARDQASSMRWSISKCDYVCDGHKIEYRSNRNGTFYCYLPAGRFDLVCENIKDNYGWNWKTWEKEIWKKSYLEINGRRYCDDFSTGKKKKQDIILGW